VFEDELFLRRPHGLEPTAFARAIEPAVQQALESIQGALAGPDLFNPATSKAHLRLSAFDYEIATIVPDFMARLARQAPGMKVSIQALSKSDALQLLARGELDLALGFFPDASDKFFCETLFSETYLVAARRGHAILQSSGSTDADLGTYLAADHVLVSNDASLAGIVDTTLAQAGLSRTVSLSVPFFLSALLMVSKGETVATLPAALVRAHATRFGLGFIEPPLLVRAFDVQVVRHVREAKNPMLNWVVTLLHKGMN
jgi:DNA-binding transcriptional LysR family regulator